MKFSQRISKTPVRSALQLEAIDTALQNKLWNFIYLDNFDNLPSYTHQLSDDKKNFLNLLWHSFFELPIDKMPFETSKVVDFVRNWFYNVPWYEIYDMIEFLVKEKKKNDQPRLMALFNAVLEQEMAGYRIVNLQVTPITDEHELREIETALERSRQSHLTGVSEHLTSALGLMADRQKPDFRNSIKESISAVEAISKKISGNPKATLDEALKSLGDRIVIHPALRNAFQSMYGYTGDGDGIRHALTEESKVDFEDAKYMLVTCAAFINYLFVKAQKAGRL